MNVKSEWKPSPIIRRNGRRRFLLYLGESTMEFARNMALLLILLGWSFDELLEKEATLIASPTFYTWPKKEQTKSYVLRHLQLYALNLV